MEPGDFSIADMQSLSVEGSGLRRTPIVSKLARGPNFENSYDWTTLWYDVLAMGDRLLVVCPKLLNFKAMLADGALRIDGQPARIRRVRRFRRHDIVILDRPEGAQALSTNSGRWSGQSGISPDESGIFAGLNASLHISRNNRLEWIADWARFHIAEHGLEAMLVMDNASDEYTPQALLETLAGTGLKRAVVLKVPQRYGPVRSKSGGGGAKFLQPAMFNLARLRFLRHARAVLNVDIDELVWSRGGSIFDATHASPLGIVAFDGTWRSPLADAEPLISHADHLHPEVGVGPCPTKYCIRPDGWRRFFGWDVHRPDMWLPMGALKRADFGYWHCRAITINWKSYDRLVPRMLDEADDFTSETLTRLLPRD
ncbi:hypothetical protein [Aliiruegeria lutimaris]|uniref:Uncharacterized protein n=1 Tax=Aliiruegeria lutimaris TaxID=571298 RepID=A0A1G8MDH4_9RHOB|nr:hypothetical protein [Aliiruegeria lutimaris]SDI65917.1 hypothetical protein SAMN04488026_100590 [Aliiruegeria lutimaris]